MTSRTAAPPRVTGGRPATMTRSAVQQARTQARPSAPTAALEGLEPQVDGWVSVDHHRRKHKPGPLPAAAKKSDDKSRELRRTQSQSAADATADKDEPPVARPNARADALSAAVTMDKKARERSYYASPSGATSPPAALTLNATWGSPPPPPGFMSRSKSTSPDAAALQLERASSLQKLMSAWQVAEAGKEQPGNARNATRATKPPRSEGQTAPGYDFEAPAPELNLQLRRAQSDVLPQTVVANNARQRSPTGRNQGATNEGKTPNGNGANANNTNGNSKKCGDKRDFFFRNLDFETRSLLQIDEVASFSVTDFEMAKKISMAIVDLFPGMKEAYAAAEAADAYYYGGESPLGQRKYPLVITDATACVGGNVLSFCDFFQFVYAIENDATRVSMLENNLRVLQKFNVSCRCASYLDVMYEYHQDVIFFDPPWGGPEYKDQDKVDLYLDEQPLYEICESLQGYAQVIVLKVPTNFDDEKFAYCVPGRVTVRKDFKKMHLVVLDFR